MTHPNPSTALARVIIDELAHRGTALIVISPGSRSGALAIAASQHPEVETRVVIDERSAAFHALGAALGSRRPAAVICTSGSAAANFFPAIVEADMSCVPLVVISADRPAELQGVGANQTIDQVGIFGRKVRDHVSIEAPDGSEDLNLVWRRHVGRLVSSATGERPGPVHLNVRSREPTVPVTDDGRTVGTKYTYDTPRVEDEGDVPATGLGDDGESLRAERGLVIAGDGEYDRDALDQRASVLGWPVLATALSGLRGRRVVTTYHHILRHGIPAGLEPETVVAVGSIGPSPRLDRLVAAAPHRVRIDRWGRVIDPDRNATLVLRGQVERLLKVAEGSAGRSWANSWLEADRECKEYLAAVLADAGDISGASVVTVLDEVGWEAMVVSSSLPIREVDAHLRTGGPVFSNRGASGIDGFVSTALGIAATRRRTLALAGDLSVLHDSNGFMHDDDISLTLVVVDNGGGGLFDTLPQARHAPDYERLFVTNPGRDFEHLARFHHLRYAEARSSDELKTLVGQALDREGVDLIRVPVDRSHDLKVRAQLDECRSTN